MLGHQRLADDLAGAIRDFEMADTETVLFAVAILRDVQRAIEAGVENGLALDEFVGCCLALKAISVSPDLMGGLCH